MSCASAGNCSAGGYTDNAGKQEAFVVSEVNGMWDNAVKVPGTAALNTGDNAQVTPVSCAAAGYCAGCRYAAGSGNFQAFLVSDIDGGWGKAEESARNRVRCDGRTS